MMRTTPSAILNPSTASEGAVDGWGGFPPVTRMVPAITTTSDRNQPRM